MGFALDFTRLDNIAVEMAKRDQTIGEIEVNLAKIKLNQLKENHNNFLEFYKSYQENIKASGNLRAEILKGVQAGEDITTLFLKASKYISLMTGDKLFNEQIEKDIVAIRGWGLAENIPLELDLDKVKKRLDRLTEALCREVEPDAREHIERAIKTHEEKITHIETLLKAYV